MRRKPWIIWTGPRLSQNQIEGAAMCWPAGDPLGTRKGEDSNSIFLKDLETIQFEHKIAPKGLF